MKTPWAQVEEGEEVDEVWASCLPDLYLWCKKKGTCLPDIGMVNPKQAYG